MAEPAPQLRVVDAATGELHESCEGCSSLAVQLAGAETEIRAWRTRYAKLKGDREADASEHPLWPEAVAVFRYWQERCEHPRAEWSAQRFELVAPFLEKYGPADCRRAIRGAAFDAFTVKRKNGKARRFDAFELIFRSAEKFEDFCDRDPDHVETISQATLIGHAREVAKRILERAKLIEGETDPVSVAHLLLEIDRLNREWLELPITTGTSFLDISLGPSERLAGEHIADQLQS